MKEYKLKENGISRAVTKGYKAIEDGVVDGYKAIENGVVKGYKKIERSFVERFLEATGETEDGQETDTTK